MRNTTQRELQALTYLNGLRESGETNMYGAAPYVQNELGHDKAESRRLVKLWMDNFNLEGNYKQVM